MGTLGKKDFNRPSPDSYAYVLRFYVMPFVIENKFNSIQKLTAYSICTLTVDFVPIKAALAVGKKS